MPTELLERSDEWSVSRAVVDEVDGIRTSISGVEIEAIRTESGPGPNRVLAARGGRFVFNSISQGLPTRSRTRLPDDAVIAAVILAAPPGSRWCEIDLRPGSIIVYGPGSEHAAVNLPGLRFAFALITLDDLAQCADALMSSVATPPPGEVRQVAFTDKTQPLKPALESFADAARRNARSLQRPADDVARALVLSMTEDEFVQRIGVGRSIDSRRVVHACIDYAEATQRIPSITELCLASHVSERRLREAFVREFDLPPSRYFRNWALEVAHRRLMMAEPVEESVTDVALDIGFDHLGRFAGHYRVLFGESPSTTLRTSGPYVS